MSLQTTSSPNYSPRSSAYLVFRQGGRWTDVFRLVAGSEVCIGRSSQSDIVIRSDQCSRNHARISFEEGAWTVADLNSRNGILVNGKKAAGKTRLDFGDTLEIAGCQMTLVREVSDAFRLAPLPVFASRLDESDESNTLEDIDASVITERRQRTPFLEPQPNTSTGITPVESLLRAAFELARSETPEKAASIALVTISQECGAGSGAALVVAKRHGDTAVKPSTASGMTALATLNRPGRSYRRLPDRIATAVLESGEAILARNIATDMDLASPDSQGNLSSTSTLCVPIPVRGTTAGIIHVYSADDERELTVRNLEYAMAVAANLGLALEHLYRERQLTSKLKSSQKQLNQLRTQISERTKIVGNSPAILEIQRQIARAAPTNVTVLIRGESGVGKELVAAAIHEASHRKDGPFVCMNCAALSPSLLESELFGHEKGAFTGATERKLGKFEAADGGTLMLDEVGEMSPEIQAKFLRVLEGQSFERVGGNQPIRADVRVIAATNRDLEQAVREGKFRSDLYFRLHVVQLVVPPLRERHDDIALLARYFLQKFSTEVGRRFEGFTDKAVQKLEEYRWPGNIRELKNTLERAVVLSYGPLIDAEDLLLSKLESSESQASHLTASPSMASRTQSPPMPHAPSPTTGPEGPTTSTTIAGTPHPSTELVASSMASLAELERDHIESVLRATEGNKSQAAKILGIERSTLDRKLKRFES